MNLLYWILWPAFLVAALATGLLIIAVDPRQLEIAGHPLDLTNIGAYTLEFLVLWVFAAVSSLTTFVLLRDGDEINRSLFR